VRFVHRRAGSKSRAMVAWNGNAWHIACIYATP
jgi:hypothetical protein